MPIIRLITLCIPLLLATCAGLPVKGKVCYVTAQGEVCAESDGGSVLIGGNVNAKWAAKAKEMRGRTFHYPDGRQFIFRGGIGLYPTFVHIDTRGVDANW